MLTRLMKTAGAVMAATLVYFVTVPQVQAQPYVIYSGADSVIVNGWWDSTQTVANDPGEMTVSIAGVVSGVATSLLGSVDSLTVDSCYAFSSLESLQVADEASASAYDTLYFPYVIQNQGNVTDSFTYVISLVDTADANSFVPTTFDLVSAADSITPIAGVDSVNEVTRRFGTWLTQDATQQFVVRVAIPSPLTASDGDTLRFGVNVKDSVGTGGWDAWPDTIAGTGFHSARRLVFDTLGAWLHTGSQGGFDSIMFDYGDDQYDTVFIAIAAPIIRLSKSVSAPSGKLRPGDTLTYTIRYDNDGTSETRDTANIIDVLPAGVMYVGIDSLAIDTVRASADSIDVDYLYGTVSGNNWLEHEPSTVESLMRVTALRFQVPPGVGAHDGDNPNTLVADDSLDEDAGFVTFKVRIR